MPGQQMRDLRKALEEAEKKGFQEGYRAAVVGAMSEGLKVPQPEKRPFRMGCFTWNRHEKVRIWPIEFGNGAKNDEFARMLNELREAMAEQIEVLDPSPADVGFFLGQHGGPLNPMETGLMILREWSAQFDAGEFGERLIGEYGVCVLMTYFRDVLGGFYAGARSRGGEKLEDEAMEAMRAVRKAKRF